ncbi:hypothetical protein D3C87_1640540 [compost metagenome]
MYFNSNFLLLQLLLAPGKLHAAAGGFYQQEMAEVRNGLIGADRQRFVERDCLRHLARVERKDLPLLGNGCGERLGETAAGKDHFMHRAAPRLAGAVGCDQRHANALSGQRMFDEAAAGEALDLLAFCLAG